MLEHFLLPKLLSFSQSTEALSDAKCTGVTRPDYAVVDSDLASTAVE